MCFFDSYSKKQGDEKKKKDEWENPDMKKLYSYKRSQTM